MRNKFAVSPYRHIKVGGRRRAWITFPTKEKATNFIKERRLKNALIYVKKRR
jgi:hypothetical protein